MMMVRSIGCSVFSYLCSSESVQGPSRKLDDWSVFIEMPLEAEHQLLSRGHGYGFESLTR